MIGNGTDQYRVLLLPATPRDAQVTCALLLRAGLDCTVCDNAGNLASELQEGAGVMLFTDEALHDAGIARVIDFLQQQPPWSDLPTVLLSRTVHLSRHADTVMRSLRNVTVLDRPTPSRTLISSVQAAIRARARQYQMRTQFITLQASELALQRASEALQDANRRKDEFLAMLAHELRNPLAPIRSATEVMARIIDEPNSRRMIALVRRQVTQMARLVDDLLDVSRITEGRIELRRAPTPLRAILAQAQESVEPLMREKQHTLRTHDGGEPLFVSGDHARLVQSVANLLTNAAKYTDAGGQISLSMRRHGDEAAITVADNGVGISADLLPRLFDLFVQGERSLARSQGGLGIGLSVVKRLVEMHGGRIDATSAGPNRGSTFEIRLPLIPIPPDEPPERMPATLAPKRILIVDDNRDAAESLAEILSLDGHSTDVAFTATDAVSRATTARPDVMLLDLGLPDMSGYEVAGRLRPLLPATQIIALTGYGQADDVHRAATAGFDAHLIKPVDFDRLMRIIGGFDPAHRRPSQGNELELRVAE